MNSSRISVVLFAGPAFFAFSARSAEASEIPIHEAIESASTHCLDAKSLASHVAVWLGKSTVDSTLHVTVSEAEQRASFRIEQGGRVLGDRTFDSTSLACVDLKAAVALAIALSIDDAVRQAVVGPALPQDPASGVKEVTRLVPVSRPTEPDAAHDSDSRIDGFAQVGWVGGLGTDASFGTSLGGSFSVTPFLQVRLGALYVVPRSVELGTGGAKLGFGAGFADVCATKRDRSWYAAGCLGGALGRWSANGYGYPITHTREVGFSAATGKLEFGMQATSFLGVDLSLVGFVPFERLAVEVVDPSGNVVASESAATVGAGAFLGTRVAFF